MTEGGVVAKTAIRGVGRPRDFYSLGELMICASRAQPETLEGQWVACTSSGREVDPGQPSASRLFFLPRIFFGGGVDVSDHTKLFASACSFVLHSLHSSPLKVLFSPSVRIPRITACSDPASVLLYIQYRPITNSPLLEIPRPAPPNSQPSVGLRLPVTPYRC